MPVSLTRALVLCITTTAMLSACGGSDGTAEVPEPGYAKSIETGPTGEQGPQGIPGPIGPVGPQGETGIQGAPGAQGIQGLPGNQGLTGPKGDQGIAGVSAMNWQGSWVSSTTYQSGDVVAFDRRAFIAIQATTGSEDPTYTDFWELLADKGDNGVAGQQGEKGDTGLQGVAGIDGAIGPQGPQGIPGADGVQGAQGIAGIQGDVGPQGIQGIPGTKGDTGSPGAQGIAGVQGEIGPQGEQGIAGVKGDTGSQGEQGIAGVKGDTGSQGEQGVAGIQGDTGSQGIQGIAGVKGDTGSQGEQGVAGIQGDAGIQGVAGPAGADGPPGPAGDTGPRGMTWQGAWESAVAYAQDDAVSYNNGSYIATIATSPGITPESSVFWEALVEPSQSNEIIYEFVGYSSTTVLPGSGRFSLNAACQTDFGLQARVARSDEIVFSGGAPSGSGLAWYESYTGRHTTVINAGSDCVAWMNGTSGASGRTLNKLTGQYANALCDAALEVACAKPIIVTAPMSFKGYSTATVQPGAGRYAMNAACETDFGAGARIARSDEIVFSGGAPGGAGNAWYESYTGRDSTAINAGSDCSAWMSGTSGSSGRTVDMVTGQFSNEFCNNALNVACSSR